MRPNEQADPDGIWRDEERQWLLFEAKTDVQPARAVSADVVRQAATHQESVANRYGWPPPAAAATVLVTHQAKTSARRLAG